MTEMRFLQNGEAAKRLKVMGLSDDIVLCSYKGGQKRRFGKSELFMLQDAEKAYPYVVYHTIYTMKTELPDLIEGKYEYAMLYVSDEKTKWDAELENLKNCRCSAIICDEKGAMRVEDICIAKAKKGGYIRAEIIEDEESEDEDPED